MVWRRIQRTRLMNMLPQAGEAKALFKSRHYDGAAYLCGYAVEIALKARVCRHLKWNGFPENKGESRWSQALKTHDLDALLELSGVQTRIMSNYVADWSVIDRCFQAG